MISPKMIGFHEKNLMISQQEKAQQSASQKKSPSFLLISGSVATCGAEFFRGRAWAEPPKTFVIPWETLLQKTCGATDSFAHFSITFW